MNWFAAVIGLKNRLLYFMVKYAMRPSNWAQAKIAKKCAVSYSDRLAGRLARATLV